MLWCARSTCLASARRGRPNHRRCGRCLSPARLRTRAAATHGPRRRRWITTRGAPPHKKRVPPPSTTFLLHLDTRTRINPHLTHPQLLTQPPLLPQPPSPPLSKCLPKLLRRLPPPAARPRLARPPPRRRRLARRPPLPPATRRSAPRAGRRPTPPTSTRVSLTAPYAMQRATHRDDRVFGLCAGSIA